MEYHELKLFVLLKKDLDPKKMYHELSKSINQAMLEDDHLKLLHELPTIKHYVYSGFYPINQEGYKANNLYMFDLRTVDQELAIRFKKCLLRNKNNLFQVMNIVSKSKKQQFVRELHTLTPTIATFTEKETGVRYWTHFEHSLEQIVERMNQNANRKYQEYMQEDIPRDHAFIKEVKQLNRNRIVLDYKGRTKFITNKFQIKVNEDPLSQKIAWLVMGAGLLEKNALGLGFCNARS